MFETFLKILVMLLATNGAPVLVARIFQSYGALSLDLGKQLRDGHPVFGSSKTWRGLVSALFTSCMLSIIFGYGIWFGLIFGALVMTGDLFSSFVKRRRDFKPGDRSIGWDQLPESLFPAIYTISVLGIEWWWAILLTLTFALLHILISKPLYRFNIRKHPY